MGAGEAAEDQPVPMPEEGELYTARRTTSTDVPLTIPYRQGDIFDVSAADEGESLKMLFMHPCTMRDGAVLSQSVTVLDVRKFGKGSSRDQDRWEVGNYFEIPLRRLRGNRNIYVADMRTMAALDSSRIPRAHRVASLSDVGMLAVQHRLIFHLTRMSIAYPELEQVNRALLAELEMQRSWNELSVSAAQVEEEAIVAAERQFDEFLSANDRRNRLRDPAEGEPVVRREFLEACLKVFGSMPG